MQKQLLLALGPGNLYQKECFHVEPDWASAHVISLPEAGAHVSFLLVQWSDLKNKKKHDNISYMCSVKLKMLF